jgi:TonB family protein
MTEQMKRREAENKTRGRMLITLVLLLITLAVVLVKDRALWFGSDETPEANEAYPASIPTATPAPSASNVAPPAVPSAPVQAPSARSSVPAAKTATTKKDVATNAANAKNEVAPKSSAEPATSGGPVVTAKRAELPPIDVEVVAGDDHRTVRPGNNSVKVTMPPHSGSALAGAAAFNWSPVVNAAERDRLTANTLESIPKSSDSSYPSLSRQMNVQGSVLLRALVGADGGIRDLRVLSGPPILVSAALEAARQWRFKPYLQNGQPVETQAKITVNFTIKVL